MSDVDTHSIVSVVTEVLSLLNVDSTDIKYYQTASEPLRQKKHVLDPKTKLNAACQSAGPEQRRAINLEIERLMAKIRL